MVKEGYRDVGYTFVNVDDCWQEEKRDPVTGELVPDKKRFPDGIDGLARYVHARGLKLGLYTDIGSKTCGGFAGSGGNYELDAKTFARWGVDSIKVDGCYANSSDYPSLYPAFGAALASSGRPMVYYCSWPAYIIGSANFSQIARYCNGWRAFDDIQDSSSSLFSIIEFWRVSGDAMAAASGPGAWSDADMLIGGNFGLSFSQARIAAYSLQKQIF